MWIDGNLRFTTHGLQELYYTLAMQYKYFLRELITAAILLTGFTSRRWYNQ